MSLLSIIPVLLNLAAAQADSSNINEFLHLEQIWNEAHQKGNSAALDSLWAEELVVSVPRMPMMRKEESLAFARSGRMRFLHYRTSELQVHRFTDVAVVTGRVERAREFSGRRLDDDWRFTKVYVRRDGRWQVVAWHASESPKD